MQEEFVVPSVCADERETRRAARRSYLRVGLGLLAFSLIPTVLALALSLILTIFAPALLDSPYISWMMQVVLMYGIAFPIAYLIIGKPSPALTPVTKKRPSFLLFFTVFCLLNGVARIGAIISEMLMQIVGRLIGIDPSNPLDEFLADTPLWIVFVVVVVIGPIVEELIFRRAVMERLLPFGEKSAILFSGVAFGLMHGNFYQLFYTVGMGILIGYLYARTRKVIYPILLHMVYNFMGSIIPLSLMPLIEELSSGEISVAWVVEHMLPLLGMLAFLCLQLALPVTGLVLFIVFYKRIHFEPCSRPLAASAHARACFLNVGVILFALFTCFELVLSVFP